MSFLATAYGPPWNSMEGSGITSTGVNLQGGKQLPVIAVDPSVIPYGSIVRVSDSPFGQGKLFVAADTGGAIKGNHIDFFVASGRSAQNGWGARHINVQVVQRGGGRGSVNAALQRILKGWSPNTAGVARQRAGIAGQPTVSTSFSGGQTDIAAAGLDALMAAANARIDPSGKFKADNPLGRLLANIDSGQYTTPSQADTTINPAARGTANPALRSPPGHNFHGYVNPISGAILGRTDMGIDASGLPNGHPIRAIGDSKVIGISPNWYAGQPYVLFQLTSGPDKGKYYYISEAIRPRVRPGQFVRAGDVVGVYNSGGTGLELGWGSPTPGRTLAAGHYHEGDVTAEGLDFRHFFSHLR